MTDVQIRAAKDQLPPMSQPKLWTAEHERTYEELSCREMMISIFAYWGIKSIQDEHSFCFEQYLQKYLNELGRKRFDQIRTEQIADFEKATITRGVYTDHEGCTYNSINWGQA